MNTGTICKKIVFVKCRVSSKNYFLFHPELRPIAVMSLDPNRVDRDPIGGNKMTLSERQLRRNERCSRAAVMKGSNDQRIEGAR